MAKKLVIRIDGDASGFRSATDEADGLLGKLGAKLGGIAKTVGAVGAVVGGAAVAIGAKLGIDAVNAASDLEQSIGGVEAVFGAAADKIKAFGSTSAKEFGLSANAVNELTAPLGALLSGLGYTQDQAADSALQISKLGADLSAAFGGSPEEAVQALGSALRGEFDPAEKFGVALSAATVEAKAMEMGLADATGELSAQAKAQATLALFMERTKNVQGQAAREADTFAGRSARLSAQLEDLKARIGQQLLPVAIKLAEFFADVLLPAFERFGPVIAGKVAPVLKEIIGGFRALVFSWQNWQDGLTSAGFAGVMERIGIAARQVFEWMRVNVPPVLAAIRTGLVDYVIPAVAAIAHWITGTLVPALATAVTWFRDNVLPVIIAVGQWIGANLIPAIVAVAGWITGSLVPAIITFAGWLGDKLQPIIADLVQWFNAKVAPALGSIRDAIVDDLVPALREAWAFIQDKVGPVLQWIADEIVPRVWAEIQRLANFIMDYAVPAWVAIQKKIVEFVLAVVEAGVKVAAFVIGGIDDVARFAGAVATKIAEVISFFVNLPTRIREALGNLGSTLYNAGQELIGGLLDGIRDKLSAVWDEVSGIAGRIADLKGPLPYDRRVLVPNGMALMQGLATGIKAGLGEVNALVGGIAPQMALQVAGGAGAAPTPITVNVSGVVGDREAVTSWIHEAIRRAERSRG